MPDLSGLYPQPPQQQTQGVLSGNPAQMLDTLQRLQQYQLTQQQFPALAQQPAATLQNTQIANQTAIMQQQATARQAVHGYIGNALSGIDKPTADDVRSAVVNASRAFPQIATQYPDLLTGTSDMLLQNPKSIKQSANQLLTTAISPESAVSQVSAPPSASGAAQQQTLGAAISQGAHPIGQAPGQQITQEGAAAAAKQLEDTATTSPQYHADLENLKQDSGVLDNLGGPSVDVERKLNALTQRIGNFGITMSPDQMRAADSFSKIANQISLNQSASFAGTDAGRLMTVHANPSLEMSKYGRDGVIDMLQGNQDARDLTRNMWFQAKKNGAPANSYYDFTQALGNEPLNPQTGAKFDPRVFQFNRMNRPNQQKFLSEIGHAELPQFESNYKEAIARGWVKPLKPADAAQ